jgi:tartronate-semialdehyde synthase
MRATRLRDRAEASRLLHEIPKPTIAIIPGPAAGAGLALAMACDFRVAVDSAKLTVAFAKVGLSGDYDFQFMIEELAVGAQFRLPYVQVLVNNSYLGLIRQSQRGFEMDYCVQLAFENQNVSDPTLQSYGVDHQAVVQGLGCRSLRVIDPEKIHDALIEAQAMARKYSVPVVVEVILEKVTNIAMGTEIDKVNEFEDIDCRHPDGLKGLELAGLLE